MEGTASVGATYQRTGESWLTDGTLDTVLELNQECLGYLAARGPANTAPFSPLPETRALLAASPYLLVDARFEDESHWRALTLRVGPELQQRFSQPLFVGPGASDFIRRVLMFAWHMARTHPRQARVVLGMTPACADLIARLRLKDLDWLAQSRPGCVRLRWEREPRLWRHLLRGTPLPECETLTHAGLRGLQLLASQALCSARQ